MQVIQSMGPEVSKTLFAATGWAVPFLGSAAAALAALIFAFFSFFDCFFLSSSAAPFGSAVDVGPLADYRPCQFWTLQHTMFAVDFHIAIRLFVRHRGRSCLFRCHGIFIELEADLFVHTDQV